MTKLNQLEIQMTNIIKSLLLLSALFIYGCASTPEPVVDTGNSSDSQRSHAKQAQDELSREVK